MKSSSSPGCVTVTQARPTFALALGLLALLAAPPPAKPQTPPAPEEDFIVYTDSPRLLLNSRRLRLMQREQIGRAHV